VFAQLYNRKTVSSLLGVPLVRAARGGDVEWIGMMSLVFGWCHTPPAAKLPPPPNREI
jgi:hypothetical protein